MAQGMKAQGDSDRVTPPFRGCNTRCHYPCRHGHEGWRMRKRPRTRRATCFECHRLKQIIPNLEGYQLCEECHHDLVYLQNLRHGKKHD